MGTPWLHLRLCLTCGHVGCCDSSPMRHARAHAGVIGHPIVRSLGARRGLAVVLRGRGVRMTQESVGRHRRCRGAAGHGATRRDTRPVRRLPSAERGTDPDAVRLRVAAADLARRVAHRRGPPRRGVLRRALRPGRDRQGVRHPGAAGRAGARAGPVPRRAGPAHRAGRVLHGDRRGPRRGARGARRTGCASWPAAGSRVRRPDPARLPDPAHPGHRRGARLPDRRLAVLGRHPQAARVRGPQPAAAPVRRPGDRRGRRGAAAGPRRHARRDAGGGLAGPGAAQPDHRRAGRADRAARRPTRGPAERSGGVGAGPAGLAAAVYGASEGLRTPGPRRASRPAARRPRHRGSRTTSASRPASRAPSWPSGP